MDLVDSSQRRSIYASRVRELHSKARELGVSQPPRCCGTSIWDETLYRAWSKIVHSLVPNVGQLERDLTSFAKGSGATEAVVFERKTFLVIARSGEEQAEGKSSAAGEAVASSSTEAATTTTTPAASSKPASPRRRNTVGKAGASSATAAALPAAEEDAAMMEGYPPSEAERKSILSSGQLHPERFEKISELVKNLRGSCSRLQGASFQSLEVRGQTFAAYLDVLTADTYVLVIVADPGCGEYQA